MYPESDHLDLWFKMRAQRHRRGAISKPREAKKMRPSAAFFLRVWLRVEERMRYWLMKSEPGDYSIDDLMRAAKKTTPWFGVRNFQARNFMRDEMQLGDQA